MKPSTTLIPLALLIGTTLAVGTEDSTASQEQEAPTPAHLNKRSDHDWALGARVVLDSLTSIDFYDQEPVTQWFRALFCPNHNNDFSTAQRCQLCCKCNQSGAIVCDGNGSPEKCGNLGELPKLCAKRLGGFLGIGSSPRCECLVQPFRP